MNSFQITTPWKCHGTIGYVPAHDVTVLNGQFKERPAPGIYCVCKNGHDAVQRKDLYSILHVPTRRFLVLNSQTSYPLKGLKFAFRKNSAFCIYWTRVKKI